MTVVEGATCDHALIRVNVTIGGHFFQANATAQVVRLERIVTRVNAYPSDTADERPHGYLYPLPCNAGQERLQLVSEAYLTDGVTRRVVTSGMTYVSNNTAVVPSPGQCDTSATPGCRNIVRAAASPATLAGTVQLGATLAEYNPGGSYSDGAAIVMDGCQVTVSTTAPPRTYSGTSWVVGLPADTLNGPVGFIWSTTYKLSYQRTSPAGEMSFDFPEARPQHKVF